MCFWMAWNGFELLDLLLSLRSHFQVVNYLKSEPGRTVLVDFPGEFRLLGALWKPSVDVTPLDTAIRGPCRVARAIGTERLKHHGQRI